jgi:hypothetical protein
MVVTLLSTLLVSTALGQVGAPGCTKDADCKGDRICVAGECRSPGAAVEPQGGGRAGSAARNRLRAAPAGVADERSSELRESRFGVQADVGGFLFFGPSIAFEVGLNPRVALYGEVRALGFGAVRYAIAGDTDGVHNSVGLSDYGIGGGVRVFFGHKANRQGFYVGGLGEYVSTHTYSDATASHPALAFNSAGVLLAGTAGYRWVFPNRMTLGLGGALGAVVKTESTATIQNSSTPAPSGYHNTFDSQAGGLLTAEIGFAL